MKKKTHKIHLSTLNVHSARRKAILYFTAFIRSLSSNNGVLSNGCAIRYINAFPYYRTIFIRVGHLVVINIDLWAVTLECSSAVNVPRMSCWKKARTMLCSCTHGDAVLVLCLR